MMLFSLPSFDKNRKSGQAVLIILLTVSVILVIGFSVASRSVTDIKLSQQTEESTRVFWAAQAGLEQAIKANTSVADSTNPSTINNINYFVSKSTIGGSNTYVFDDSTTGKIGSGEIRYLWLKEHTADGELDPDSGYGGTGIKIYWGQGEVKPAIAVSLIYVDGGGYYNKNFNFQVNNPATNFTQVTCSESGGYACNTEITDFGIPGNSAYLISFKLYYLAAGEKIPLKVESVPGSGSFPGQGSCFESVATNEVSNITRKLKECQTWKQPTQISYLLFSGSGGIEK